jgi:hypothetical protein
MSQFEYWELSNISANIAVAILRVRMTVFGTAHRQKLKFYKPGEIYILRSFKICTHSQSSELSY